MKKQHVVLSAGDRTTLQAIVRQGTGRVRPYRRALALLELEQGSTFVAAAALVGVSTETLRHWRNKYVAEGLAVLEDAARSGRPVEITGAQRAKITALACTTPPEGHGSWTLRMLAEQAVELGYCERISHTHVSTILKKTNSSRT